jgi:hypothetical protein
MKFTIQHPHPSWSNCDAEKITWKVKCHFTRKRQSLQQQKAFMHSQPITPCGNAVTKFRYLEPHYNIIDASNRELTELSLQTNETLTLMVSDLTYAFLWKSSLNAQFRWATYSRLVVRGKTIGVLWHVLYMCIHFALQSTSNIRCLFEVLKYRQKHYQNQLLVHLLCIQPRRYPAYKWIAYFLRKVRYNENGARHGGR